MILEKHLFYAKAEQRLYLPTECSCLNRLLRAFIHVTLAACMHCRSNNINPLKTKFLIDKRLSLGNNYSRLSTLDGTCCNTY